MRPRRRARLRVAVDGGAPLRRLHDVPGPRAVAVVHGRPAPRRAARLRRDRAAVARPAPRRRAGRAARPRLTRPHDPGHRPRSGAHRVRRVPRRHEHVARAVRRVRPPHRRGPRDRVHGVRQRVRDAAPAADPAAAGALVPGPHVRRRGVTGVDAPDGRARHRRAGDPAEAVADRPGGRQRSTSACTARSTARAAASDLGRVRLLRRERRPGRGDGPHVDRRELRVGDAPLRVRRRPARGRQGLRVLHGHHALRGTPRCARGDRRLRQPHAVGHAGPDPRQVRAHAHDDRHERPAARVQLRRHAL